MEAREKKRGSPVPAQREIGDGGRAPATEEARGGGGFIRISGSEKVCWMQRF